MRQTMKQIIDHSPDYKLNKINNYDNTIKNVSRRLYETCDMTTRYPRLEKNERKEENPSSYINAGSYLGPGNRAILYGSWSKKKKKSGMKMNGNIDESKLRLSNERSLDELRN